MRVTELIAKLQSIVAEHGDTDVIDEDDNNLYEVDYDHYVILRIDR